jgi:hypothetical protein
MFLFDHMNIIQIPEYSSPKSFMKNIERINCHRRGGRRDNK